MPRNKNKIEKLRMAAAEIQLGGCPTGTVRKVDLGGLGLGRCFPGQSREGAKGGNSGDRRAAFRENPGRARPFIRLAWARVYRCSVAVSAVADDASGPLALVRHNNTRGPGM